MSPHRSLYSCFFFFFFNDTATTEISPLSLHDALPILRMTRRNWLSCLTLTFLLPLLESEREDRKSTRLNSSHTVISYAVFCLKKKKTQATVALYVLNEVPLHK